MNILSLVIPVFNEEKNIEVFYKAFLAVIKNLNKYEIIFVDDGSKDNTLNIIKSLIVKDNNIKYISFSRNFGKESAIYAGLKKSIGDYVVVMDVDLQDPMELLPEMYNLILTKQYDIIATKRINRKGENAIRSFLSQKFYVLFNKLSKIKLQEGLRDYRMMTRKVVDSILSLKEYNRFSKGICEWVGFKTKYLEFENKQRSFGQTKWSLSSLFVYAFEGIVSFSTIPLIISSFLGILLLFVSIIIAAIYFFKTIFLGDPVKGFPTLICSIYLIGGIQLFCIGVLGQYIAKIYTETKERPLYIIEEESL